MKVLQFKGGLYKKLFVSTCICMQICVLHIHLPTCVILLFFFIIAIWFSNKCVNTLVIPFLLWCSTFWSWLEIKYWMLFWSNEFQQVSNSSDVFTNFHEKTQKDSSWNKAWQVEQENSKSALVFLINHGHVFSWETETHISSIFIPSYCESYMNATWKMQVHLDKNVNSKSALPLWERP